VRNAPLCMALGSIADTFETTPFESDCSIPRYVRFALHAVLLADKIQSCCERSCYALPVALLRAV
jgi:hypothetical protein